MEELALDGGLLTFAACRTFRIVLGYRTRALVGLLQTRGGFLGVLRGTSPRRKCVLPDFCAARVRPVQVL